jgi:hypothetical protein
MRALKGNEARYRNPRRLDVLLCNVVFSSLLIAIILGSLAFLATRTHMFHRALMRRQQIKLNNMWLVEQCKAPSFYSNMKQHSSLCDDVVLEQTDSLWLHALRDVIDNTYVCGDTPCINRIEEALKWLLGRGIMILAAVAGSAFFVFFIFLSIHRHLPGPSHNVRFYTDSVSYPLLNELGPPAQRITL